MSVIDVSELNGKSRVEVAQYLKAKSDEVFDMYKDKVVQSENGPIFKFDDPIKDIEEYRKNQEVLGEIGKYHDTLVEAEGMASEMKERLTKMGQPVNPMRHSPNGEGDRPMAKSLGELFTKL